MITYPAQEQTFSELSMTALRQHYATLKAIFVYLIAFTALKGFYFSALDLSISPYAKIAIHVAVAIIALFLIAAGLLVADRAFKGEPLSFKASFLAALQRLPRAFAFLVLYIAGAYLARYFGWLLLYSIGKLINEQSAVHSAMLLISLIFLAVFMAIFCLMVPLSIVEEKVSVRMVYESIIISGKQKFGILVLFLIVFFSGMFLSPVLFFHKLDFVKNYGLGSLVDFIILSIVAPFFINVLLLIINDGKIQMSQEGI